MRVSEDAKRCVVFFGTDGEGPDKIDYGGTGFLAVDLQGETGFPVLVTCRHVAKSLSRYERFYIRANTWGTQSYTLPAGKIEWAYHPDETVDLAATQFILPSHTFDAIYYRLESGTTVLGEEARSRVFCGEPISLIGLFRLHPGKERNISFVHTGNVAVLPDSKERIPIIDRMTGQPVEAEVYLVEAQTLDGLSGSPAFVHELIDLDDITLEKVSPVWSIHPKAFGVVRLLGLYIGSWDGEPGRILAEDRNLHGNKRVPVGVGIVVPADRILELVREHPLLKKQHKEYTTAVLAQRAASQDSAIPDPPTGDANPKHREDFNSLVGAAARKRERED
jgi:hypothetical protein